MKQATVSLVHVGCLPAFVDMSQEYREERQSKQSIFRVQFASKTSLKHNNSAAHWTKSYDMRFAGNRL
jgi:hypothetical protein